MTAELPELLTPRLVLRQPSEADLEDLLPISFYNGKPAKDKDDALQMLGFIAADISQGKTLHWGMALKETNRIIGTCGFYRGLANQTGEIGYVLHQNYHRKGYTLEAVLALLNYGFDTLQLKQILAYTDPENVASSNLLRKAGFTEVRSDKSNLQCFKITLNALN